MWVVPSETYSQTQAHSSSDTEQFDSLRKKESGLRLNGRCDWEHEQIQCLSDSHLYHMHIHTHTQRVSLRPDPTAAAMCISHHTILFPRHFTNCAHQICVGSPCGGGSFSS